MKKLCFAGLLFLGVVFLFVQKADAAFLKFDKSSVSLNADETFTIGVVVDAGSDEITSIDAYVLYDSSILEAQSVTPESFFPTVLDDINSQRVYVAGMVDDPATSKTGTGTVATITFKALKSGSVTLSYDCRPGASDSSKIVKNDVDSTDIIVCSQNETATITVSGSSTAAATPTPATSSGEVTELPQSGILDNILRFAVPGMLLVLIGGMLKLFL